MTSYDLSPHPHMRVSHPRTHMGWGCHVHAISSLVAMELCNRSHQILWEKTNPTVPNFNSSGQSLTFQVSSNKNVAVWGHHWNIKCAARLIPMTLPYCGAMPARTAFSHYPTRFLLAELISGQDRSKSMVLC